MKKTGRLIPNNVQESEFRANSLNEETEGFEEPHDDIEDELINEDQNEEFFNEG